jgi:hypothetical protein
MTEKGITQNRQSRITDFLYDIAANKSSKEVIDDERKKSFL